MEKFADRLKRLRKEKNFNQAELAAALGVSRSAIANYEQGARKPETDDRWKSIAKYFDVTVDYLMSGTDHKAHRYDTAPNTTVEYSTFPIIGEVAAGYEHIAVEDWEGDTITIPDSWLSGRSRDDYFVLRVKGDSMYPEYQDGDKLLVLKQSTMDYSGQIGVAIYDNEIATVKKVEYKMGENWMRLVPINPNFPKKMIENEDLELCRILGVPVKLIRDIN